MKGYRPNSKPKGNVAAQLNSFQLLSSSSALTCQRKTVTQKYGNNTIKMRGEVK